MINEAWIKTKSQELDIPFSHILSAYVLETTVRIFAGECSAHPIIVF